jgi:hypothetical protein
MRRRRRARAPLGKQTGHQHEAKLDQAQGSNQLIRHASRTRGQPARTMHVGRDYNSARGPLVCSVPRCQDAIGEQRLQLTDILVAACSRPRM